MSIDDNVGTTDVDAYRLAGLLLKLPYEKRKEHIERLIEQADRQPSLQGYAGLVMNLVRNNGVYKP